MARIAHVLGNEWRSTDIQTEDDRTFSSFLLSDNILFGLKTAGFIKPSPIQYQAIPLGRSGLDLIVQAKSGTGKTCVFAVIALEKLLLQSKATQALVLAPTREVAVQICQVVKALGCGFSGLQCHTFIGGLPVSEDKIKLKHCHIAVGTPGRIKQLIKEDILKTTSIRLFVLDEADKLLEEGFQESINWIYSSLPIRKQMLALSATFPEKLAKLLELYMINPALIRLNADQPALIGITQYYSSTMHHPLPHICFQAKVQALLEILKNVKFSQCIVFSNYQTRAESLCDALRKHNWPTDYISGSQEQNQRLRAIDKLKKFKCRVMVSTDLTSRGIDVENVNLVVNMDVPWEVETYLHRIGRAGRFGTRGLAITFVSGEDETTLFQEIVSKGALRVSALPEPLPPDLWLHPNKASFNEKISEGNLLHTQSENSSLQNLNGNLIDNSRNNNQDLIKSTEKVCPSSNSFAKEQAPSVENTQNSEQSAETCNGLMKSFTKSLQQQINIKDTLEETTEEMDEETKLLLSLNSFLVSNHEEFRLKLEDEFEKYDHNTSSVTLKHLPILSSTVSADVLNSNTDLPSLNDSKTEVTSSTDATVSVPQSHCNFTETKIFPENKKSDTNKNEISLSSTPTDVVVLSPIVVFSECSEYNKSANSTMFEKPIYQSVTSSTVNDSLLNSNTDVSSNNDSETVVASKKVAMVTSPQSQQTFSEKSILPESDTKVDKSNNQISSRPTDVLVLSPWVVFSECSERIKSVESCEKSAVSSCNSNDTISEEIDEETKLLLSLNSFLASNHEEYRLKLEDEYEKYDNNNRIAAPNEHYLPTTNGSSQNSNNVQDDMVNSVMKSYKANYEVETANKSKLHGGIDLESQNPSNNPDLVENSVKLEAEIASNPKHIESSGTCTSSNSENSGSGNFSITKNQEQIEEVSECQSEIYSVVSNAQQSKSEKLQNNLSPGIVNGSEHASTSFLTEHETCRADTLKVFEKGLLANDEKALSAELSSKVCKNRETSANVVSGKCLNDVNNSDSTSRRRSPLSSDSDADLSHKYHSYNTNLSNGHKMKSIKPNSCHDWNVRSKRTSNERAFPHVFNEKILSSSERSNVGIFNKHSTNYKSMSHSMNGKYNTSRCSCVKREQLVSTSDYDGYLWKWWNPNTRMALKYLEYQNFMSHLFHYRSNYSQ